MGAQDVPDLSCLPLAPIGATFPITSCQEEYLGILIRDMLVFDSRENLTQKTLQMLRHYNATYQPLLSRLKQHELVSRIEEEQCERVCKDDKWTVSLGYNYEEEGLDKQLRPLLWARHFDPSKPERQNQCIEVKMITCEGVVTPPVVRPEQ
jgi:hypothetical protein